MGCCNNKLEKKTFICPICKSAAEEVHYVVVETVLKEDLKDLVANNSYYTCTNKDCDMVFFSEDQKQMFLTQDIDYTADFKQVTKAKEGCGGCGGKCGKNGG